MYARKKNDLNFLPARLWYLFIPLIIVMTLYSCTTIALYQYPQHSTYILKIYNAIVFLPIVLSHLIFSYLSPRAASEPNEYSLITSLKIVLGLVGLTDIFLLVSGNINDAYNPYIRSVLYLLLSAIPVIIIRYKYVSTTFSLGDYPAVAEGLEPGKTETAERKLLLEPERHAEVFTKLEEVLKNKKLYKDEDLTLEKLSAASGINRYHISETLNVFAKKSFYQYINEYRVQEVIYRLDAPSPWAISLLAVAYECGFKTKASFNQYFKKIMGVTPSGYLKNKKAAEAA
jgi:AraC-like DNA-binding protein